MLRYDHTNDDDDVPPPSNPRKGTGNDGDLAPITDADADGTGHTKAAVPYSDVFFDDAADKQNTFKPQRRASESHIIPPSLDKMAPNIAI